MLLEFFFFNSLNWIVDFDNRKISKNLLIWTEDPIFDFLKFRFSLFSRSQVWSTSELVSVIFRLSYKTMT